MQKIITVAIREFSAMVATKAFLFSLIMMPILMAGGLVLMPLLTKIDGGKERRIVVADATGQLFEKLKSSADARNAMLTEAAKQAAANQPSDDGNEEASDDRNSPFDAADKFLLEPADSAVLSDEERLALSDQMRSGELYAFVEIPVEIVDPDPLAALPTVGFVGQDSVISAARQWLQSNLQDELRNMRLEKLGLDKELVKQADLALVVEPLSLYEAQSDGSIKSGSSSNAMLTLFLPFGTMMLMFLILFLCAQPMLESGMEEKSQRIAELLLGAVTPNQLMVGKLLGNVAGSILIFMIYGIGGWFVLDSNGWADSLPWEVMPWFLVFQILGVLFYSSIFLTVGASISDLKEAQSLLLPVWMMLMIPMMIWFVVIRDPNGTVPVSLSFFPPATSMMMILRLATGQTIPGWQPPVAAIGLFAATLAVLFVAGRLYRVSLLRTDPVKSVVQLLARLRQPVG